MVEFNRIGSCARLKCTCFAAVSLIAGVVQSHAHECSDSFAAGRGPRSLLQVSQVSDSFRAKNQTSALCVVQRDACVDMELDPAWNVQVPELEAAKENRPRERFFGANEVQLVIARYTEDLRWLDALPQVTAIVYNRGGVDGLLPASRPNLVVIEQENRGREDEVMLNHIVTNYDKLSATTLFLQGWPFEHCPGAIKAVRLAIESLLGSNDTKMALPQQSAGAIEGLMPIVGTFVEYDVLLGKVGLAEEMVEATHSYPNSSEAEREARDLYNKTCMEVMGGQPCPRSQWGAYGSQWAVSRERIRSTPRHVYEAALKIGEGWQSKFRGLVLEGLWPTLWGASGWQPTEVVYQQGPVGAFKSISYRNDGLCTSDSGSSHQIYSCESHMEFCERKWQAGHQQSQQFEIKRKRFQIHDASLAEPWHVMVEMAPVLWGLTTWKPKAGELSSAEYLPNVIEVNGSLYLEQNGTDSGSRPSLIFRMTESSNGLFALATAQSGSGDWLYLGCDGNRSKLVKQEVSWEFEERQGVFVALRSEDQLWLTMTRNQDGALVHCLETKTKGMHDDQTFHLELLMRNTSNSR